MVRQLLISRSRSQRSLSSSKGGGVRLVAIKTCLVLLVTIWMVYRLKFSLINSHYNNHPRAAADNHNDDESTKSSTRMITARVLGEEETVKLGRKGLILTGGGETGSDKSSSKGSVKDDIDSGISKGEVEEELRGGELVDGDDDEEVEDSNEEDDDDDEDEMEAELLDDTTEDESNSQTTIENDLSD